MAISSRVKLSLSPAMAIALRYMAEREDAAEATVARRLLRAQLDKVIHSADVQELIAKARANASAREWAELQAEAAEELRDGQTASE